MVRRRVAVLRQLRYATAVALLATTIACRADSELGAAERAAIADSLAALIAGAYDFGGSDPLPGLLALYPDEGPVVSAAAGRVTTSRDSLEQSLRAFWEFVGQNMRDPEWVWDEVHVDVLGRDAAVLTGRYRIPHRTPDGRRHEVIGAWTAVFERREGRWVIVHEHLSDAPDELGPATDSLDAAGDTAAHTPH